ncbi:urease accessory protein UreF [Nonomuraea cavernae]|uniref:Urease accessory protein UreF n=1 Tax=Nonomuraea cavernae TaxID=2045107 RepID=A0A917YU49_9ACTN|nr:urease accessory UreF family protein [Nonomuraea cavernae]MCA2185383.1 urease accessory protein UreF [Nonomuraea cavernae]GGO66296.1 urease accessory protein UreF [Nonomuraea cavernae]
MHPALLLLTDSRLPAGGHAHSGGAEQAVASGAVHDLPSLSAFLRGRLHTSGRVATAFAAACCAACGAARAAPDAPPGTPPWTGLDAEADARTASPAQRAASRIQGRLLLRVARRVWPAPALDSLALAVPDPHHPVALGAAAHAAGASPGDAALAAAYHAVTGPATAAARLLGLDPVEVHRLLADLAPDLKELASLVSGPETAWAELSAHSAPALDLLAERHARAAVRLFVS